MRRSHQKKNGGREEKERDKLGRKERLKLRRKSNGEFEQEGEDFGQIGSDKIDVIYVEVVKRLNRISKH